MLEYIILGFLMEHELTGYDLKQRMTHSTSYFFDASFGSIYPALTRLEKKGFINFREVLEGGKYKKVYRINDSGTSIFMKWLKEPIAFERSKHTHLVKIFFYDFLPSQTAIINMKNLIGAIEPVLKDLESHKERVTQKTELSRYFYQRSALEYGIDYYRFVILWCKRLIAQLESE